MRDSGDGFSSVAIPAGRDELTFRLELGDALAGAALLAMAQGFTATLQDAGREDNAIVLRGGSGAELNSGFGGDSAVKSVEIRWPSGTTQVLENVKVDQVLKVEEPAS